MYAFTGVPLTMHLKGKPKREKEEKKALNLKKERHALQEEKEKFLEDDFENNDFLHAEESMDDFYQDQEDFD